jgi:hypothetical protein
MHWNYVINKNVHSTHDACQKIGEPHNLTVFVSKKFYKSD